MKKLFFLTMLGLSLLVVQEGNTINKKAVVPSIVAVNSRNPRGEKRPHDGRGRNNYNTGKQRFKNNNECQNPDKGPGYGRGEGRGNGKYRN